MIVLPHPPTKIAQMQEEFVFGSVIRRHHVYREVWIPYMNEELATNTDDDNSFDKHAVALLKTQQKILT